jgi:hypothetical protein
VQKLPYSLFVIVVLLAHNNNISIVFVANTVFLSVDNINKCEHHEINPGALGGTTPGYENSTFQVVTCIFVRVSALNGGIEAGPASVHSIAGGHYYFDFVALIQEFFEE